MSKAKPIPDGYHTATPYLIADDAAKAIEFYKKAFGASEKLRIPAPGAGSATRRSRSATRSSCSPTSIPRSGH